MRIYQPLRLSVIGLILFSNVALGRADSENPLDGQYFVPTSDCADLLNSADYTNHVRFKAGSVITILATVHELKVTLKGAPKSTPELRLPIGKFPLAGAAGERGQFLYNRYATGGEVFESSVENLLPGERYPVFQILRGPDNLQVNLNWGERACDLKPL